MGYEVTNENNEIKFKRNRLSYKYYVCVKKGFLVNWYKSLVTVSCLKRDTLKVIII